MSGANWRPSRRWSRAPLTASPSLDTNKVPFDGVVARRIGRVVEALQMGNAGAREATAWALWGTAAFDDSCDSASVLSYERSTTARDCFGRSWSTCPRLCDISRSMPSGLGTRERCEALIRELREWQEASGPGREQCARLAERDEARVRALPLVHGVEGAKRGETGYDVFLEMLETRELRSKQGRNKGPHRVETAFGIEDRAYLAAGFLYPDKHFAFVFDPSAEHGQEADASPWDTGKFYGEFGAALSEQERLAMFEKFRLPAPEYRNYLCERISSFFASGLDDYFTRSRGPSYRDPLGIMTRAKPLSWVFEVRIKSPVRLDGPALKAVFLGPGAGGRRYAQVQRVLNALKSRGVTVVEVPGLTADMQGQIEHWVRERLTLRNAP